MSFVLKSNFQGKLGFCGLNAVTQFAVLIGIRDRLIDVNKHTHCSNLIKTVPNSMPEYVLKSLKWPSKCLQNDIKSPQKVDRTELLVGMPSALQLRKSALSDVMLLTVNQPGPQRQKRLGSMQTISPLTH